MLARISALVLLLSLTFSAHALDLAGRELFIPVAGRTPGAAGTFWQTDLLITSLSPEYDQLRVRVDFHSDGNRETFEVDVQGEATTVIEDFVRTKLGRDSALGTIRLTAAQSDAQFTAEAVVNNTGGSEPLGQTVQALPISALRTRSLIGSLLVERGHRSNVGVGNPHDEPLQVSFSGANGLNRKVVTVAPHSFVQMNARDAAVSLEADSRVILVSASKPIYAYGSVIRGGDGDPQFVLPVEVRPSSSFVVEPACATAAAPLLLSLDSPAPGWIVVLKDGVESDTETPRLAARHGFTPRYVYSAALEGFGSELTPQQVAALRCESTVRYIEQNQWMSVRGVSTMAAAARQ